MNSEISQSLPDDAPAPHPAAGLLLREWLLIGLQSFGGGNATFALIRQAFVERKRWIEAEEFNRLFALVQIAPGINLLALTILIGKRLLGWRGLLLSLFGLLLPSVAMTTLLTAGYARVQHTAIAQNAMHGFLPATVGLGCVTSLQMAHTSLKEAHKEGRGSLVLGLCLLAASGLAVGLLGWAVLPVLFLAGSIQASATGWRRRKARPEEPTP
ncbi:MAG: chromate transporter [Chthonomonadaceae bacterium]|nr:chromate transporter [Chthonomonadaceae bacterium]